MGQSSRHVLFAFQSEDEFWNTAVPLVTSAIDRDELVIYAAPEDIPGSPEAFRARAGTLTREERLITLPLERLYAIDSSATPDQALNDTLDTHLQRTDLHRLNGLRIFSVSTRLAHVSNWRRWEIEVGRRSADREFTVICAYDASVVEQELLGDLACLHQELRSRHHLTSFRLYPTASGAALAGEVDSLNTDRLQRVLHFLGAEPGSHLTLDVTELRFINHDGLMTIQEFARDRDVRIALMGATPTLRRLHEILRADVPHLEIRP